MNMQKYDRVLSSHTFSAFKISYVCFQNKICYYKFWEISPKWTINIYIGPINQLHIGQWEGFETRMEEFGGNGAEFRWDSIPEMPSQNESM